MVTGRIRYDLESVKGDIRSFFKDDKHHAYQYGSKATFCDKNSLFYKKQIQVIFEEWYPHDVTGKAVNELIDEGFFKTEPRTFGVNQNVPIIFFCKRSRRYLSSEIKDRLKIIERFSDPELNDGCGKYAEALFIHMFEKNQFKIVGLHTKTYKVKTWSKSDRNLDFIIEKDGLAYGGETKNTFDYIPQDEFEEKLDMCSFLGILPVFPLRYPSPQQFEMIKQSKGLALTFKTRIFPPGNQRLVSDIWNHFRLPVGIWYEISTPTENIFLNYHNKNISI